LPLILTVTPLMSGQVAVTVAFQQRELEPDLAVAGLRGALLENAARIADLDHASVARIRVTQPSSVTGAQPLPSPKSTSDPPIG